MNTMRRTALAALAFSMTSPVYALEISGAIEIEAGFSSDFQNVKTSDINLATVELGIDSQINERVNAHLVLLHEEDDTPLEVDEGSISINMAHGWSLTAGQMYLPFGVYESNMISDPLTLELGESRESAILINYQAKNLYASAYIFNGDTIEASAALKNEDSIKHFGFSIGKIFEYTNFSLDIGLDYINSIGDTDGLFDNLTTSDHDLDDSTAAISTLQTYVNGIAFHWLYNRDALAFIAEYIKSDNFQTSELAFNSQGASPSATNLEFSYTFGWGTAAVGYQTTDEAVGLGLPNNRRLFSISHEIFENTVLNYEYATDKDYSNADGGTGRNASTSTIQLVVVF